MTDKDLITLARGIGFEYAAGFDAGRLTFRSEVRAMCASGRCKRYGKCWSCPPACGTVEALEARAGKFSRCVLVQTVSKLDGDFDAEGLRAAEALHKRRFAALARFARETAQSQGLPAPLPLAAGTCTLCPTCTCPDEPCRNPESALVSMEAAGLLVSDACEAAHIPYYHGKGTMAYTSCVLV